MRTTAKMHPHISASIRVHFFKGLYQDVVDRTDNRKKCSKLQKKRPEPIPNASFNFITALQFSDSEASAADTNSTKNVTCFALYPDVQHQLYPDVRILSITCYAVSRCQNFEHHLLRCIQMSEFRTSLVTLYPDVEQ
uniref:Uncharacterized protein n=1 Tax=Setaria digitata TaxID=48799 RepID=A0A915PHI2_9BILA